MEYTILESGKHYDLTVQVNDYLKQGWVPFGATFGYIDADGDGRLAQAMVKETK
jgi:hypothetical protein